MKNFVTALIAASIVILGVLIFSGIGNYLNEQEITIVVKHKERVISEETSKYLVWSEDETFENRDSLIKGKFNSSDLYGKLEKDHTYKCKVYGWRVQFFSWYRNIIECKEAE